MKLNLLLASAALCASLAASASAQVAAPHVVVPDSSVVRPDDVGKRAHTNTRILQLGDPRAEPPSLFGAQRELPPFPGYNYETPASLACVYGLVVPTAGCNPRTLTTNATTGSKVIAIVDAYDDPTARADLKKYSAQFGLPAVTRTNLQIVYARGGRPAYSEGWAQEASLDIEMAHAMAPKAKVILVEAASNSFADLLQAETVAANLVATAGGGEVSNSWGSDEFSIEQTATYASPFVKDKVVFFASTGDNVSPSYPAILPTVVAAGGTSIQRNSAGNFTKEATWEDAGVGPSAFVPRPGFQNAVSGVVGAKRGIADISADANPNTGVWVYWSGGWWVFGGTSVSSPMLAGITNSAKHFLASGGGELKTIYAHLGTASFHDIVTGKCGPSLSYGAKPGYDFCTGVGTPKGFSGI